MRDDEKCRKRLQVIIELNGRKLHLQRELKNGTVPNSCGREFKRDDVLRMHLARVCAGVDPSVHGSETSSINIETPQRHTPEPRTSPRLPPLFNQQH